MKSFSSMTALDSIYLSSGPVTTVVIAGAADDAALRVVGKARKSGIQFILVGEAEAVARRADESDVDISDCRVEEVQEGTEEALCRRAVALCRSGEAGVLMKGHVGTAAFTRAILDRQGGLTGEGALLSHVGLFEDPRNRSGGPFLLTDAAINILPDLEAKKVILANAVSIAGSLGITAPRIALLAPVEKVVPKIPSTTDAAGLKVWVRNGGLGDSVDAVADGPFALDVAASADAAAVKGLDSPVAGRADIYLAPNLDAGNILYKSLTVFAGAKAAGILAGAKVPVVLTSRSDTMDVKLASLGLALNVAAGGRRFSG